MRTRWLQIVLPAVLAAAVIAAYAGSLDGAFVFDDRESLERSLDLVESRSWRLWPPAPRALLYVSLAANHAAGGRDPRGYHAVNVLLHALAALALFGVARRTILLVPGCRLDERGAALAAFSVALPWSVHPLTTQAVTYVVQRCEVLMALFLLLTLYAVIRGASSGGRAAWYVAAAVFAWLGFGSKEVMISAPFVVLLFDRLLLAGSLREIARRRGWLYALLGALSALYVVLSLPILGEASASAGFSLHTVTWHDYALSQPGVIAHYLRLVFWPDPLVLDYGWPAVQSAAEAALPAALLAGLLAFGAWSAGRRPVVAFCIGSFFVVLGPTSSVLPIADLAVEHRMYLPLAAVLGLIVATILPLARRVETTTRGRLPAAVLLAALAVLLAVPLGMRTAARNADYRSPATLWGRNAEDRPGVARVHLNHGTALIAENRDDEAVAALREAVRLSREGDRTLLATRIVAAKAHDNLAELLRRMGSLDEALENAREAHALAPRSADVTVHLARVLERLGRHEEAEGFYREALAVQGDFAPAHRGLARQLVVAGRYEEALVHIEAAALLGKKVAQFRRLHAATLVAAGRPGDAIAVLRAYLAQRADMPLVALDLAWLLATHPDPGLRDGAEAVRLAAPMCGEDDVDAVRCAEVLAAAHAEAGDFAAAVESASGAAALARENGRADRAQELEAQAAAYRRGEPLRDGRLDLLPGRPD